MKKTAANPAAAATLPATRPAAVLPHPDPGPAVSRHSEPLPVAAAKTDGLSLPLSGYARFDSDGKLIRPDASFALVDMNLSLNDTWVLPLKLGLPVDASLDEITKKSKSGALRGDLYEPKLGVLELLRGTLMSPLDLPPLDKNLVEPLAFDAAVATRTCEQIADKVTSYHRLHPQTRQWTVTDGEHYALLDAATRIAIPENSSAACRREMKGSCRSMSLGRHR